MTQTSLDCAGRVLDLSYTNVMGVLNVTPDSFYKGSRYQHLDDVLRAAESMVEAGVDIFDVGGESTRPGADGQVVTPEVELERVIPAVEALASRFDKVVSVDTSSALVMGEAVKAGAGIINDVRALAREGALDVAVKSGVPVVLMHSLVEQPEPGFVPGYKDVVKDVSRFLLDRAKECQKVGMPKENIILDPGFGAGMFGKTPAQNLSLLKGLKDIARQGFSGIGGFVS